MQISHQHKLIIFSQYGSYCRIDSYGDIPGQVVSLFDLRIWTLKSALSLYSGLGLLVVKKFPSEGEQMVREANGQSKLRFSQVFWTLVLAMTLSHNFLKCENMCKTFSEPLFSVRRHLFTIIRSSKFFCLGYIFGSFIWRSYIHFGFPFEVAVVNNYFSYRSNSQQFVNVFLFFFLQHQHSQLFIYFHRPVIFPDLVDFPSVHKFSTPNFHFPYSQQFSAASTFILNCSKEQILFSAKISHSQQVHKPAYK